MAAYQYYRSDELRKVYAKADKIWIINYSHYLGFCYTILEKSGQKYLVL